MRPTLFIAGATGVIGSRLAPALVKRGYRVFGLTRSPEKVDQLWRHCVVPIVADVFDRPAIARALLAARPDAVIHMLTDLPRNLDRSQMEEGIRRNSRMRGEGTASLVTAASEAGVTFMIAQSVAWAYATGGEPRGEDWPLDVRAEGLRAFTVGGVTALENSVLQTPGIKGAVLRFGQLYGPGTGSENSAGKNLPLHIDAAVAAILLAVEHEAAGVYNIVEPNAEVSSDKARRELSWNPLAAPS